MKNEQQKSQLQIEVNELQEKNQDLMMEIKKVQRMLKDSETKRNSIETQSHAQVCVLIDGGNADGEHTKTGLWLPKKKREINKQILQINQKQKKYREKKKKQTKF